MEDHKLRTPYFYRSGTIGTITGTIERKIPKRVTLDLISQTSRISTVPMVPDGSRMVPGTILHRSRGMVPRFPHGSCREPGESGTILFHEFGTGVSESMVPGTIDRSPRW
jgi:hypothetical protein